jgi:hypothetical protein
MAIGEGIWGGKLKGAIVELYVDSTKASTAGQEAIELLNSLVVDKEIKSVNVIDLRDEGVAEPLPYLSTSIGRFRGLVEITYFVDHYARFKAAANAA